MSSLNVAIYARVSTADQNCEMQLRELREFCTRRNWKVVELPVPGGWDPHEYTPKVDREGRETNACKRCSNGPAHSLHTLRFGEYVDTGYSGAKASRPELDRLMKDARQHRFEAILVWKIDRFSRSVLHLNQQLADLTAAGIRFLAVTQNIDTDESNPTSRLLLQILGAVAEFEREMIRERVKTGMAAAKHHGKRFGRPKSCFDRVKAQALHAKGLSIREIAERLKTGRSTVHRLLQVSQKGG